MEDIPTFQKPEDRFVLKRSGRSEKIDFRKIRERLEKLAVEQKCVNVNLNAIVELVERSVVTGIRTSQLDRNAANACSLMGLVHPDYTRLAGDIAVSNLHKETPPSFLEALRALDALKDIAGRDVGLIDKNLLNFVERHQDKIEKAIDHNFDYELFSHSAVNLLESKILLKDMEGKVRERPQHMWMRVALTLHKPDLERALMAYRDMARGVYAPSLTALMSAGTKKAMMLDSYAFNMGDSLDLIYETIRHAGLTTSKGATTAVTVSDLRCAGSIIRKTNGTSTGLVPMLRVMNEVAATFDMGGRKKAELTVYMEPWHNDVEKVLDLKKPGGTEELRARTQEYALMVPDIFMRRVRDGEQWSLFCPDECQRLTSLSGEEFDALYEKYEKEGRARTTMPAKDLWRKITLGIAGHNSPKIIFKDNMNKTPGKAAETIQTAGGKGEMAISVNENEPAAAAGGWVSLIKFCQADGAFDFDEFKMTVHRLVESLNELLERSTYSPEKAKEGTRKQRPLAIGVQGLADAAAKLGMSFESEEFLKFNQKVFRMMHFAALEASSRLVEGEEEEAMKFNNEFIFERAGIQVASFAAEEQKAWEELRTRLTKQGTKNTVLLAQGRSLEMATLMGTTPGCEMRQSNLEPKVNDDTMWLDINPHLVRTMIQEGEWTVEMKEVLMAANGLVGKLGIPNKDVFKTSWEVPQKRLMELAMARAPYICQSEAMVMSLTDTEKITPMLFYAWKNGLKTGLSTLITEPTRISKGMQQQMRGLLQAAAGNDTLKMVRYMSPSHSEQKRMPVCSLRPPNSSADEPCLMCGS